MSVFSLFWVYEICKSLHSVLYLYFTHHVNCFGVGVAHKYQSIYTLAVSFLIFFLF